LITEKRLPPKSHDRKKIGAARYIGAPIGRHVFPFCTIIPRPRSPLWPIIR
jgi:hypothetical protein